MPGFDDTVELVWCITYISHETYKSGCDNCHIPTPAEPKLKATLAQVKIAPAHASHPVKYEAKLAYCLGASSLAQKYCPPELGMALASSDSVAPTQVETNAIHGMPYMVKTVPPELMPVMREAEMPNHEFAREKATPSSEMTEKLRSMSCV